MLDTEGVVISHRTVPQEQTEAEVVRVGAALAAAADDARDRERDITDRLGQSVGAIFHGHAFLYEDPGLRRDIEALIRTQRYSAEYAASKAVRGLIRRFDEMPADGPMARLKADFLDLEKQVLGKLMGAPATNGPIPLAGDAVIILAGDLTPSETAQLDPQIVHAFATESGGPTSHTAIMAGALEIPAVVGIGRFLSDVSIGDTVIVDGTRGLLILDPDEATLERYTAARAAQEAGGQADNLRDVAPVTRCGTRVLLLGNIEFPHEAPHCLDRGAEGVGLYRTEFLYVNKTADPTEAEHYEAYKSVLTALGPDRPVVIRTLDIGADKFSAVSGLLSAEKNPFLGLRSVRLCLKNLVLFKTQLRAILRASVYGDARLMFPMVSTVMELRQCKSLLAEVKEDLEEARIPFKPDLPIGTMIEVPSAALIADVLAREVDFFSIGTNDLVQYTLAADRNNENVAGLYNPADPAVLRLMKMVCDAAATENITVNVCGEMSGEPLYVPLLIGLGIRQLSATPRKIPELKRTIRNLTVADAERIARESMRMETAREVTTYLREQLRRILPDAAD
ncbi:Phosphoenolpyruvate-protein phosphotransferase of PTS system [Fimbriiglobus ruber]|uniref:Phosphoenolpyruvate-protein phosphotransferase n=1 Tax=Fimbriiglobus ruber TaxID=1908690 RepID=A0A225DYB2_9BACT|nr:Phosphoenolpyruvate-protein phosphotransferase of PTS system [Fimbriiglobus ruber]